MRRRWLNSVVLTIVMGTVSRACLAFDSPPSVNLLRLTGATLEYTNAPVIETDRLKAISDGDPGTSSSASATEESPLTIVFGFGGKSVTVEHLTVTAGPSQNDAQTPTRLDLLVSNLSAHAGFQSLREEPLKDSQDPQEFPITPTAAKWVMLRFTPNSKSPRISLAEINVRGHEGTPLTRYQFKESPAKAFDVIKRLEQSAELKLSLSPDEASLFDDAKDGKLDRWSFAEAALLSSGVQNAGERRRFLTSFEQLERDLKQSVSGKRTPFDKGAALLKFLHAGPMSKGYSARQTSVSAVLETGTFNCVSSATLFNILGRRLGLDVRGIEVPQHAFSIVYDGARHADVETTTELGFNPSRDPKAQHEFTRLTGFAYIPDSNRAERREVDDIGLVAITYYNRGVGYSEQKQYQAALIAYFCALSLDSEFDSAIKNALSVLVNWSAELAQAKKHEEALSVLATGLALAPQDAALLNNHRFVWSDWAQSLMNAGKNDEALAILGRAVEAIPDAQFDKMQSWVFIRQGEEFIKSNQWETALALLEPGLKKLENKVARESLAEWGESLRHRWAQTEEKEGHFESAAGILDAVLKEKPDDEPVKDHLAYLVQEWLASTYQKDGADAAAKVLKKAMSRYPQSEDMKQVGKNHLLHVLKDLNSKKEFDKAVATAEQAVEILKEKDLVLDLVHSVFDSWAAEKSKNNQWQEAVDVYEKALKKFPQDPHLQNNLRATWTEWAHPAVQSRDWAAALDIYEKAWNTLEDKGFAETNIVYGVQEWSSDVYQKKGIVASNQLLSDQLKRFPKVESLPKVAESHVQRVIQKLAAEGKYEDAFTALNQSKSILKDEIETEFVDIVYDTWAATHRKEKDWQKAIDVYAAGRKKYPKDAHLERNSLATWYEWAKSHMDKKDWKGAVRVYEDAILSHPGNSVLENNLKYCQEQLKKQ